MPSDEHLNQLRQQRALVRKHLDWLDEEIQRETGDTAQVANVSLNRPALAPKPTPESLKELASYRPDPQGVSQEAKRGCLIFFVVGIVLLLGTLVVIYFWKYRDRPVLYPDAQTSSIPVHHPAVVSSVS